MDTNKPLKIRDDEYNRVCNLSYQVYKIKKLDEGWSIGWPIGTLVRLISGIQGRQKPGFHPMKGYVTVCRANNPKAEFVGIRFRNLKKIQDDH